MNQVRICMGVGMCISCRIASRLIVKWNASLDGVADLTFLGTEARSGLVERLMLYIYIKTKSDSNWMG